MSTIRQQLQKNLQETGDYYLKKIQGKDVIDLRLMAKTQQLTDQYYSYYGFKNPRDKPNLQN